MASPDPSILATNTTLDRLEQEIAGIIDERGGLSDNSSLATLLSRDHSMAGVKSLKELGFDSLDSIEVIMAIEKKYGLDISDVDTQYFHTLPVSSIVLNVYYRLQQKQPGSP